MAETHIASLEAHLTELIVAKKFDKCDKLQERIDQMKKAQTDLSGLKAQLEEATGARNFTACAEIQKQIDELNIAFSEQVISYNSFIFRNVH